MGTAQRYHTANMKLLVVVVVVIFADALWAEDCPNGNVANECTHVTCTGDYVTVCTNSICTREIPGSSGGCSSQSDCDSRGDCTGFFGDSWHCVDNICRCFDSFPGK